MKMLKKNMYVIVTDLRMNIKVHNFAEQHSVKRSQIEVMELPKEFCDGAEIVFYSRESKDYILESLRETFENYNFYDEEHFIFMERKMEL